MDNKLNYHFFHELYSRDPRVGNFNTDPQVLGSRYYNRIPLMKPAIIGVQKNLGTSGEISKLENIEEVLKHEKNLSPEDLQLIGNSNLCKNYFLVPKSQFHLYQSFFNDMIKSVSIDFTIENSYDGYETEISDCKCPTESSSSSSEEKGYYNLDNATASTVTLLELLENINIKNEINSASLASETKILSEEQDEEDKCCYCPPCDVKEPGPDDPPDPDRLTPTNYQCFHSFNGKIKSEIKYDEEKIYDILELETRIGGGTNDVFRNWSFTRDENNIAQPPEGSEIDTLGLTPIGANFGQIFTAKWKFNQDWKNNFFTNLNKINFPINSTFFNDPIVSATLRGRPFWTFGVGLAAATIRIRSIISENNLNFAFGPGEETVRKNIKQAFQKQEANSSKNTSNFGYMAITVPKTKNMLLGNRIEISFSLGKIYYIENTETFVCFVNLKIKSTDDILIYKTQRKDRPDEYSNDVRPWIEPFINGYFQREKILYSTDESDKLLELKPLDNYPIFITDPSICDSRPKFNKKNITLKIDENLSTQFELHSLKSLDTPESFFVRYTKDPAKNNISTNICNNNINFDAIPMLLDCREFNFKCTHTVNQPPLIKIKTWTQDNFSTSNVFPPKVE
jgi:hypothetical protein